MLAQKERGGQCPQLPAPGNPGSRAAIPPGDMGEQAAELSTANALPVQARPGGVYSGTQLPESPVGVAEEVQWLAESLGFDAEPHTQGGLLFLFVDGPGGTEP